MQQTLKCCAGTGLCRLASPQAAALAAWGVASEEVAVSAGPLLTGAAWLHNRAVSKQAAQGRTSADRPVAAGQAVNRCAASDTGIASFMGSGSCLPLFSTRWASPAITLCVRGQVGHASPTQPNSRRRGILTRKAPRARERPASWVSTEVPSTMSSVVAANTSELRMLAMKL